jgi:thioredoxin-dependent peroxiredoxin
MGVVMSLLLAGAAAVAAGPKEGDSVPDVKVPAYQAKKVLPDSKDDLVSPASFKGKKNVVLFYFPKAMTPGCTVESCGFRDILAKFTAADTVVLGFSGDTLALQQKFTEKENLDFPLLADSKKELMTALEVKGRTTWVIDKEGKIAKIFTAVKPKGHPQEVLEFVEKLKK